MIDTVDLAVHEWPPVGTEAQRARTAVLVHGITGWWKTWWRVGPALAERGWRALAVDQRAHGRTSAGEAGSIDDLVDDLEAAIERHALPPVDALIGHSLGAVVSQRLVHRRPHIARRVVLEDPPGLIRAGDIEFQDRLRAEVLAARGRPEDEVRRELAENPAWADEDARQDVEGKAMCREEVIIESIRRGRPVEVADLAASVEIPTRYLLAAPDRSVMPEEARNALRASLPAGSDVVVLDGGHTLHRDAFDEYVAAVFDFID